MNRVVIPIPFALTFIALLAACSAPVDVATQSVFAAGSTVSAAKTDAIAAHVMLSTSESLVDVDEQQLHLLEAVDVYGRPFVNITFALPRTASDLWKFASELSPNDLDHGLTVVGVKENPVVATYWPSSVTAHYSAISHYDIMWGAGITINVRTMDHGASWYGLSSHWSRQIGGVLP